MFILMFYQKKTFVCEVSAGGVKRVTAPDGRDNTAWSQSLLTTVLVSGLTFRDERLLSFRISLCPQRLDVQQSEPSTTQKSLKYMTLTPSTRTRNGKRQNLVRSGYTAWCSDIVDLCVLIVIRDPSIKRAPSQRLLSCHRSLQTLASQVPRN